MAWFLAGFCLKFVQIKLRVESFLQVQIKLEKVFCKLTKKPPRVRGAPWREGWCQPVRSVLLRRAAGWLGMVWLTGAWFYGLKLITECGGKASEPPSVTSFRTFRVKCFGYATGVSKFKWIKF